MCRNIKPIKIPDGIIVSAILISESLKAWYLNCDGDRLWFSKLTCTFEEEAEELELPKWLYREKFPNEPV